MKKILLGLISLTLIAFSLNFLGCSDRTAPVADDECVGDECIVIPPPEIGTGVINDDPSGDVTGDVPGTPGVDDNGDDVPPVVIDVDKLPPEMVENPAISSALSENIPSIKKGGDYIPNLVLPPAAKTFVDSVCEGEDFVNQCHSNINVYFLNHCVDFSEIMLPQYVRNIAEERIGQTGDVYEAIMTNDNFIYQYFSTLPAEIMTIENNVSLEDITAQFSVDANLHKTEIAKLSKCMYFSYGQYACMVFERSLNLNYFNCISSF